MKVALLPTGRTEWTGLPVALGRLFPAHEFYAVPTLEEVGSSDAWRPLDGFTSIILSQKNEDDGEYLPENATDLVGRAAQEALGDGPHREAADAVVVLDDLELANLHQPDRVARIFRKAVEQHLSGLQGSRARTADVLRQRVSFHLAVPMIEAWFFGDPIALAAAGVPARASPILAPDLDLEAFRSVDIAYLAASETDCPRWISHGRKRKYGPKWLGSERGLHPKGYLQWLCLDGSQRSCTTYDETVGGGRALAGLSWSALLAQPVSQLRYLRAFLADLSDALQDTPTTGRIVEDLAGPVPVTSLSARPRVHVLRNL